MLPKLRSSHYRCNTECIGKHLRGELDRSLKCCTGYSPPRKLKRQRSSSKLPIISPTSLKKRKSNTQQERNKDKRALAKYSHLEVTLDDDQSDEMVEITDKIDTVEKQMLEGILWKLKALAAVLAIV